MTTGRICEPEDQDGRIYSCGKAVTPGDMLTGSKSKVCRESDPSDPKSHMNAGEHDSSGVMREKGSDGSDGSANIPVSFDLEPGESGIVRELQQHRRRGLTEEETRRVQKLISEGMGAKQARAAVLGEELL